MSTPAYAPYSDAPVASSAAPASQWWLVKVTNPTSQGRVLFRSQSQQRAEAWLAARCPRGQELYLESPAGAITAYSAESDPQWFTYNPSDYSAAGSNASGISAVSADADRES